MLTRESLGKLLAWLDDDSCRAGEKYETLRLGLVRFFEWRGCEFPEDHADETIDRVARKILQGEEIRNIHSYVAGVARFVFLEILKKRERQQAALRQLPSDPIVEDPSEEDPRLEGVHKCLKRFPPEKAQLLIAYYQGDAGKQIAVRKQLAQELGVSSHTLRMRVQRLRARLEECMGDPIQK